MSLKNFINNHVLHWAALTETPWDPLDLPKGTIAGTVFSVASSYALSYLFSKTRHASGLKAAKIAIGAKILETLGSIIQQKLQDKIYSQSGTRPKPLDLLGRCWAYIPTYLTSIAIGKRYGVQVGASLLATAIPIIVFGLNNRIIFPIVIIAK